MWDRPMTRESDGDCLTCLAAALCACLCACATPPLVIHVPPTPAYDLIVTDGNTLAKHCSSAPGRWDNGSPKARWAEVGGCQDGNQIWLDSGAGWRDLAHEQGHLRGERNP